MHTSILNFFEPIYVFQEGKWNAVRNVLIKLPEETKKTIELTTKNLTYQSTQIELENVNYEILTTLTEEQSEFTPFKKILYNIIKLKFNFVEFIISIRDSKTEKRQYMRLLYKLVYNIKFLKNSLSKQVALNLQDAIYDAFLSIIKKKFKSKGSSARLYKIFENLILTEEQEIKLYELENMAYKAVIYQGLLPIEVRLKYSNYSYLRQKLHNFRYAEQTPWNCCLDSEIRIGRQLYCDLKRFQYISQTKPFLKIRILDFFPLDSWIKQIGSWFDTHLGGLISDFKDLMKQEDFISSSEIKNPQINTSIESNFMKGISRNSSLLVPLLMQKSSDMNETYKDRIMKILLKQDYKMHPLVQRISDQFYEHYRKELHKSRVFKKISMAVGDNLTKVDYLGHNPNELVSTITYIFHDLIKKISEPLTVSIDRKNRFSKLQKDIENKEIIMQMWKTYTEIKDEEFKVYTRFGSEKELLSFIPPICCDELIDYFGIFSDKTSNELFKKLKYIDHNRFSFLWEELKNQSKDEINSLEQQQQYLERLLKANEIHSCPRKIPIKNACFVIIYQMNYESGEKHKQYCKGLMYWYYNSIRLKNMRKYNKQCSCIGNVLISDVQ